MTIEKKYVEAIRKIASERHETVQKIYNEQISMFTSAIDFYIATGKATPDKVYDFRKKNLISIKNCIKEIKEINSCDMIFDYVFPVFDDNKWEYSVRTRRVIIYIGTVREFCRNKEVEEEIRAYH